MASSISTSSFDPSSTPTSSFRAFPTDGSSFSQYPSGAFPTGSYSSSFSSYSSDFATSTRDYSYPTSTPIIIDNGPLGHATLFGYTLRIVTIILYGLTGIACWAIAITAACKVRKRRDPARRFVPWMQAGLFIVAFSVLLQMAAIACQILQDTSDVSLYNPYYYPSFYSVPLTLDATATFLLLIAELIVWVALMLFDNGICLMKPVKVTKRRTRSTLAAYIFFGLMAMLQTIAWALDLTRILEKWDRFTPAQPVAQLCLTTAASACLGIAIIVLLIRSIMLRVRFRKARHVKRLSKHYLACTSIFCLTIIFHFVFYYFTVGSSTSLGWLSATQYVSILSDGDAISSLGQCILQIWVLFIILTILFSEGLKRRHNLASAGTGDEPLMQETTGLAGTSLHAPSSGSLSSPFAMAESETQSPSSPSTSVPPVPSLFGRSTSNEPESAFVRSTAPPSTAGESQAVRSTATEATAASSTSHQTNPQSPTGQPQLSSTGGQSHDHFPWAIPDEAPPEYTAPERPLPNMSAAVTPAIVNAGARQDTTQQDEQPATPHQTHSEASANAHSSETSESTELSSPPSHDQAMGLNHQADGLRTRSEMPYPDIPNEMLNAIPRDKKS